MRYYIVTQLAAVRAAEIVRNIQHMTSFHMLRRDKKVDYIDYMGLLGFFMSSKPHQKLYLNVTVILIVRSVLEAKL